MGLDPRQRLTDVPQLADQAGRIFDGIYPLRRIRRVTGRTLDAATHGQLAFMAEHRSQRCRLADNARQGFGLALRQFG